MSRVKCSRFRCRWIGDDSEVLRAPDPFNEGDELRACPACRVVESIIMACDVEGCTKDGSCGTPTEEGYRWTCWEHQPESIISRR